MSDTKKTERRYPLKCPTCGGYLSFSKRTFEQFTYCNSCFYDSRIVTLKAEVEKLKAYAQMADECLCKFTHGEMTVEQRDEVNAVINILKRARYGDDSIFRDVKLEKIIADNASEQAERYSVEEYKEWRRLSNGTIAIDDPDHGIAAFVAARRGK